MQTDSPAWESLNHTMQVDKDIRTRQVHVYIQGSDPRTRLRYLPSPLTVDQMEGEGRIDRPTLSISYEAAQALVDQLWENNIRPSAMPEAGTKELQALREHLADLRRYLDHHLGITR